MCPPPGSSTVRQVEIRIPQEFRSTTKIKLKIRPLRGKGPKMVVKSTKINGTAPNEHQIAVEATTPSATDVKYVLTYSVRTE